MPTSGISNEGVEPCSESVRNPSPFQKGNKRKKWKKWMPASAISGRGVAIQNGNKRKKWMPTRTSALDEDAQPLFLRVSRNPETGELGSVRDYARRNIREDSLRE